MLLPFGQNYCARLQLKNANTSYSEELTWTLTANRCNVYISCNLLVWRMTLKKWYLIYARQCEVDESCHCKSLSQRQWGLFRWKEGHYKDIVLKLHRISLITRFTMNVCSSQRLSWSFLKWKVAGMPCLLMEKLFLNRTSETDSSTKLLRLRPCVGTSMMLLELRCNEYWV